MPKITITNSLLVKKFEGNCDKCYSRTLSLGTVGKHTYTGELSLNIINIDGVKLKVDTIEINNCSNCGDKVTIEVE